MKAKVLSIKAGRSTLFLTQEVMDAVGFTDNSEVIIDIPVGGGGLLVYTADSPAKRLVVASTSHEKSRDYV